MPIASQMVVSYSSVDFWSLSLWLITDGQWIEEEEELKAEYDERFRYVVNRHLHTDDPESAKEV